MMLHSVTTYFAVGFLAEFIFQTRAINLTIVHTNDVHSRFVSFDKKMQPCDVNSVNASCWGGAARRLTALEQIRANYTNVLLLDGGDQFQGTLWYTLLKWKPIAEVVNRMGYTAMAFGNHEFDDGLIKNDSKGNPIGLMPYLRGIQRPTVFVATNLEAHDDSPIKYLYQNYHIILVDHEKVGILGYITPETANISHPGSTLIFRDEIESLKKGVENLKNQGVNKIIAIGHAGIEIDKRICQEVKGVDVVVGGHTNTFLYKGIPPSKPDPEGPYPWAFPGEDGHCLVVQDYAFGKYLGFLQVEFDENGIVRKYNGNPILMDNRFADHPDIVKILQNYSMEIDKYQTTTIGKTEVTLNGMRWACRLRECNFGNLITDGMIYSYLQKKWENNKLKSPGWATSAVAIANSASWRDFELEAGSNITLADMFNTLVYANTVQLVRLKGKNIRIALEHSVRGVETIKDDPHGKFLQVSGLKVMYDLRRPNGQRVISVSVKCANCSIPKYFPLNDDEVYDVITISFLKNGGDGYYMIKDNLYFDGLETLDVDVLQAYIERYSPLTPGLEGRISYAHGPPYKGLVGDVVFDPNSVEPGVECPVDGAVTTTAAAQSAGVAVLLLFFKFVL